MQLSQNPSSPTNQGLRLPHVATHQRINYTSSHIVAANPAPRKATPPPTVPKIAEKRRNSIKPP